MTPENLQKALEKKHDVEYASKTLVYIEKIYKNAIGRSEIKARLYLDEETPYPVDITDKDGVTAMLKKAYENQAALVEQLQKEFEAL